MTRILGLGLDLVDRNRIARLLERHGAAFLRRVFRDGEVRLGDDAGALAGQRMSPASSLPRRR